MTVLTATMIVGVITVVALLVTSLPGGTVRVPPGLDLPDGTVAHAVTQAPGFWIVTTADARVFVFDDGGTLLREIALGERVGN